MPNEPDPASHAAPSCGARTRRPFTKNTCPSRLGRSCPDRLMYPLTTMRAGAPSSASGSSAPRACEPNTISSRATPSRTDGNVHTSLPSWRSANATSGQPSAMRLRNVLMRANSARGLFTNSRRTGVRANRSCTTPLLPGGAALADGDPARLDARAQLRAGLARGQLDRSGGGDARQTFAAKAERVDGEQVARACQFAGGVAREREGELVASDAGAVVGHRDRGAPAVSHLDHDRRRARVEAVLDELFHHGDGALDHLAGGDLSDRRWVELADGSGHVRERFARAPVITSGRGASRGSLV